MTEVKETAPTSHWRRRSTRIALPADQAARQGEITRLAFLTLGKDEAIAFLNSEHVSLGGRPLAIATASRDGAMQVRELLQGIYQDHAATSGDATAI